MTRKSKQIMIRVEMDIYDQLSAMADHRGVQIAPMVREVIIDWASGRSDKVAELIRLVEQLSARVEQLQKQVDAHSGALDQVAKAIFYCTQSIAKKPTDIS